MVSASIKVAGAGWQSCGASGKMRGSQTLAEMPRGQGSPRPGRATPPPAPGRQLPPPPLPAPASRPAPGSCRGQNYTRDKSVHRGLRVTYAGSFPLKGKRCDRSGHTSLLLPLYRRIHLVRACAQNAYVVRFRYAFVLIARNTICICICLQLKS